MEINLLFKINNSRIKLSDEAQRIVKMSEVIIQKQEHRDSARERIDHLKSFYKKITTT